MSNDFLPFATGASANVITQTAYTTLAAQATGFQSGLAQSGQFNKVWRQSSFVAAMIGQFIDDYSPNDAKDDGIIANLEAGFKLAIQGVTRTKALVTVNFYVNASSGDDNNSGLAPASAFKTLQWAINTAYTSYDYNGRTCIINLANGTYASSVIPVGIVTGPLFGTNQPLLILGNPSSPSSVVLSGSNASGVVVTQGGTVTLNGVTLNASGSGTVNNPSVGYGAVASGGSALYLQNIIFGNCGSGQAVAVTAGIVSFSGPCTFGGTSPAGMGAWNGGFVWANLIAFTMTAGVTYSGAFAYVNNCGTMSAAGATFSGSSAGLRYNIAANGTVYTNGGGATFFPGSVAGTTSSGGVYI